MELPFEEEKILDFIESSIKQLFNAVKDDFLIEPELNLTDFDKDYIEALKEYGSGVLLDSEVYDSPQNKTWWNSYSNIIYASPEYIWYRGLKTPLSLYSGEATIEELQASIYDAVVAYCAVHFYAAKYMKDPIQAVADFHINTEEKIKAFFGEENIIYDVDYNAINIHVRSMNIVATADSLESTNNRFIHCRSEVPEIYGSPDEKKAFINYIQLHGSVKEEIAGLVMEKIIDIINDAKDIVINLSTYDGHYTDYVPDRAFTVKQYDSVKDALEEIFRIQKENIEFIQNISMVSITNDYPDRTVIVDYIICPSQKELSIELMNDFIKDIRSYTDKVYKPIVPIRFVPNTDTHGSLIHKFVSLKDDEFTAITSIIYSKMEYNEICRFDRFYDMSIDQIMYNFAVYNQVLLMTRSFVFAAPNDYSKSIFIEVFDLLLDKANIQNDMYNRDLVLALRYYHTRLLAEINAEYAQMRKNAKLIINSDKDTSAKIMTGIFTRKYGNHKSKSLLNDDINSLRYIAFIGSEDDFAEINNDNNDDIYKHILARSKPISIDQLIWYILISDSLIFTLYDDDNDEYSLGICIDDKTYRAMQTLFEDGKFKRSESKE